MRGSTIGKVAWAALAMFLGLARLGMFLLVLNRKSGAGVADNALLVLAFASIGAVGALIVGRFPRNAVGWLFLAPRVWQHWW